MQMEIYTGPRTFIEQLGQQTLPCLRDLLKLLDALQWIVEHIGWSTAAAEYQAARMIWIEMEL